MLYRVVRWWLRLLFLMLGLRGQDLDRIPRDGPVILAANHISNWDPIMVALAVERSICFIAKEELFRFKPLGWILSKVHVFPVKRGAADTSAIRRSLEILKTGQVLGIFPEGRRIRAQQDAKPHHGMAMFALKSGAPVIPLAVRGTEHRIVCGWIWPLQVIAGEPLYFTKEDYPRANSTVLEEISGIIMARINELK